MSPDSVHPLFAIVPVLAVALLVPRRPATLRALALAQSVAVALALALQAWSIGSAIQGALGAAVALAGGAAAWALARRAGVDVDSPPRRWAIVAAAALVVLALLAAAGREDLALVLASELVALLVLAARRTGAAGVIGLWALGNGVALAAALLTEPAQWRLMLEPAVALVVAATLLAAALRQTADPTSRRRLMLVGGAALSLGLFGALLFACAAPPVLPGYLWDHEIAARSDASLLTLGFVVLLLGWGTLAGLVPLHGAVAGIEADGPGVIGGVLSAVALLAILRARSLVAANQDAIAPGPPLLALGLATLLLAALALRRQRSDRRLLAVAWQGQVGVVAFAAGLGTGAAIFAALLHLALLLLTAASLWLDAGRAARIAGIAGLAMLPPFGLFASSVLIVTEATRQAPFLAVPLVLGLALSAWALAARIVALWREPPEPAAVPAPGQIVAWLLLAATALLGLAMPAPVAGWVSGMAQALR
jgi:hydrogenase-4 component F